MSAHHYVCCCGGVEATCENSCFASSYVVRQLAGTYTVEKAWTLTEPCICAGGDDPGVQTQYAYTVTYSQNAAIVWTRYTNASPSVGCCYYGTGEMTVTISGTITKWEYDCVTESFVCFDEQPLDRTRINVPFCLTAVCDIIGQAGCAYDPGSEVNWLVSLEICDFPVKGSYESCGDSSPIGIVCGGAVIQWRTKLKSFPSLFGYEIGLLPPLVNDALCFGNELQDVAEPTNCLSRVAENQTNNGPFALYAVSEFSFGQDEPDECSLPAASAFAGAAHAFVWTASVANDCAGQTWSDPPCWGIECNATSGCLEARQTATHAFPEVV